jgi:hypothetical protein
MPRSTIKFNTVREIGLALSGVEGSTAYGSTALKVRGKLLACVPTHRSAEPGSLVVRVGFDDRTELLAADPDVCYGTDHLSQLHLRAGSPVPRHARRPADLLGMAHKFVTALEARRSPSRSRRKPV